MHKCSSLSLFLITILFCSCQKEVNFPVATPDTKLSADSLFSIVVDGVYDGSFTQGYDSAQVQFITNGVSIQHFNRVALLYGTETIRYDNNGRVAAYRYNDVTNGDRLSRVFTYNGADSFPVQILDTTINSANHHTQKFVVANSSVQAGLRRLIINEDYRDVNVPVISFSDTTIAWLNAAGRLVKYESANKLISEYFFKSASGDMDSCYADDFFGSGLG